MSATRVCVLLPFYKSTNPVTAFSLLSMLDKTRMTVMLQYGDAFIAHSRNKLAERFLKTKCEWCFTCDDDMILPCGNAAWFNTFTKLNLPEKYAGLHVIDRLLSHGKTLVGSLYYHRNGSGYGVYGEGKQEIEWMRNGPHDTCKPTRWVGTGAALIHRSVFEDIERKFPNLGRNSEGNSGHWFSSSEHELRDDVRRLGEGLSDNSVPAEARIAHAQEILRLSDARSANNSGLGMGEDVAFCVRAAASGHQPHVDCGCISGHVGSHVFGPKFQ